LSGLSSSDESNATAIAATSIHWNSRKGKSHRRIYLALDGAATAAIIIPCGAPAGSEWLGGRIFH
jgi:hypothetical protein